MRCAHDDAEDLGGCVGGMVKIKALSMDMSD